MLASDNISYMEYGKRLREIMKMRNVKSKDLAEKINVEPTYISQLLINFRKPGIKTLLKISKALDVPLDVLIPDENENKSNVTFEKVIKREELRLIPLLSWVKAGDWKNVTETKGWIKTELKNKDIFGLKIAGDSMEPMFPTGYIIIIDPHAEIKPNDFVIVERKKNKEITFKQLKNYGKIQLLHSINSKYEDIVIENKADIRFIGKVIRAQFDLYKF